MSPLAPPIIVVTDLDGTLLDHHTYSFEAALPALNLLKRLQIPVIANTSKTTAEWLDMRDNFDNRDPYVVENGSALVFENQTIVLGTPREEILQKVLPLHASFKFRTYAEASIQDIVDWTGLSRREAALSATRDYSEPLLWEDGPEKEREFCELIASYGLQTLRGGRFLHVLGPTDKGKALSLLRNEGSHLIALGDRPNDFAMLKAADTGIVIAAPDYTHQIVSQEFLQSTKPGPAGWNEMVGPVVLRLHRDLQQDVA